jgi:26S proteasome regulatory subunit N7
MEVLQAKMDIARYAAKSCTKEEALKAYEEVVALPKLSTGKKMDAFLEMARVASFWGDWKVMRETLDKASKAIAKGGDWDRRNRLKAYQAISHILVRDMESASKLLVDGIATFSCGELCEYSEFITYAVVTSLLYLPRTELKKSIIDGSEILQVAKEIPVVIRLANTLYDCDYTQYLHTIVALQPHLIANRYLQPHAGYLLREFHVLGFKQFLDSYQSVTLESMASSFGVGTEFLDVQLSRFIAAGRLTAKIDKFGGVVETNRPDEKNARYRDMIQKGDLLLNRIQKLGRVVDL